MSYFNGLGGVTVRKGGVYFLPGNYLVEIVKVHIFDTRKRETMFCVDCKVLESDNPERPVGSSPTWMVKMSLDSAFGNIKGFIAAAIGKDDPNAPDITPKEWEDTAELAISAANPLAGMKVRAECLNILTKDNKPFTQVRWGTV